MWGSEEGEGEKGRELREGGAKTADGNEIIPRCNDDDDDDGRGGWIQGTDRSLKAAKGVRRKGGGRGRKERSRK